MRLRLLDGGPGGRLTYKGPATYDGAVKRRVELETAVADLAGRLVLNAKRSWQGELAPTQDEVDLIVEILEILAGRLNTSYDVNADSVR